MSSAGDSSGEKGDKTERGSQPPFVDPRLIGQTELWLARVVFVGQPTINTGRWDVRSSRLSDPRGWIILNEGQ
jgi:hypothetical protein